MEKRMRERDNEGGYALIMVALVLFLFLGFAALAVDVGVASSARTAAQRAADAAALAGAFTFINNPAAAQPATAQAHATATATQNKILGAAIAPADVTVTVNTANRTVTVVVVHTQDTFFGAAVGQQTSTVSATGLAEAAFSARGGACTKPWFIPNTAICQGAQCNKPVCDNGNPKGSCFSNPPQILIDPGTGLVTSYGLSKLGTQFQVKPQKPGCGTVAPGQFLAIQLGCGGASCYRDNITFCTPEAIACKQTGQTYCTENGDMVGPTKAGVCDLICYNDANNCNNGNQCERDTFLSIGHYQRPDGSISDTSRSLVIAPIIDVCHFCASGGFPSGGSCDLTVLGFALIFVDGVANGGGGECSGGQPGINAHLINLTSCAGGGGPGGGGSIDPSESGPFSLPLRLVRP